MSFERRVAALILHSAGTGILGRRRWRNVCKLAGFLWFIGMVLVPEMRAAQLEFLIATTEWSVARAQGLLSMLMGTVVQGIDIPATTTSTSTTIPTP